MLTPEEKLELLDELWTSIGPDVTVHAPCKCSRSRCQGLAELEQRVSELSARLAELAEKLGQNSRNSHRPPSSDSPAARGQRRGKGKSKSKRKRGAQPGHRPAQRSLLPPEEVDEVIDLFPLSEVPDPNAMRFQVTEVPPVEPYTTEYRTPDPAQRERPDS